MGPTLLTFSIHDAVEGPDEIIRDRAASALVLLKTLESEPTVTPRRARGHRHRDERRLRDLRVRRAGERRLLRVRVDAPRALRDLGDAERDELLGLAGDHSVLERFRVELEEGLVRLRRELPHALELSLRVDAMKLHDPSFVRRSCPRSVALDHHERTRGAMRIVRTFGDPPLHGASQTPLASEGTPLALTMNSM